MNTDTDKILSAIQSIQASSQCFKTEQELNHAFRLQIDPILFQVLESKYMEIFQSYWNETVIPYESERAIVIVERRCHPNLEFCIKNAVYFARGFSLYIFCSQANRKFVETICGTQKETIHIIPIFETIGTPEEGKNVYNQLLCEKHFWESIEADVCLTIETDCYLRFPLPDTIYSYDYVASKYPWNRDNPGGGGLSLRKREKMLSICDAIPCTSNMMQDGYVSQGVIQLGYTFPSWEESKEYFSECTKNLEPCGVHQWWTFVHSLDETILRKMVNAYTTIYV